MDSAEARLLELGVKQELHRSLTSFTNFAFAFNTMSIITGLTTMFNLGFGYGGPVVLVYGWLVVGFFCMLVGLAMAEICSAYPTSGGLYFWSYHLAGPKHHGAFWAWVTGWFNVLGLWAMTASVTFGLAQFLSMLIIVGSDGSYVPSRKMTVLIYGALLLSHAFINCYDVQVVAFVETASVIWNITGTLFLIIALPALSENHASAKYVFSHYEKYTDAGIQSSTYASLVGLLFAMYAFTGYDACANMCEETEGADVNAPFGIVSAISVSGVAGLCLILSLLFCVQDPRHLLDPNNETGGYALAQIIYDVFMSRFHSRALVVCVLLIIAGAIWQCGFSCLTSSSRMVFAFSRDGGLPLSKIWHTLLPISPEVPVLSVWLCTAVSFTMGVPYIVSPTMYTAVVSLATVGLNIAYAIPILLRVTYQRKTFQRGPFSLHTLGVPVGVAAVGWVAFISVLFMLPVTYPITLLNFNFASVAVGTTLVGALMAWTLSAQFWFKKDKLTIDSPTSDFDDFFFSDEMKRVFI